MKLSFVIPLWNEQESLRPLVEEIASVCEQLKHRYEILLVDDGSTDESWGRIRELAAERPAVRGLRLRSNSGKADALQVGFRETSGDLVFTLDADLQDDPKEIPRFLEAMESGYDVVSGWKVRRRDPWTRRVASKFFNGLVNWCSGLKLHDHNCGFKCLRSSVLREIELYGDMHRFLPVLAAFLGFRVGEIPVHHRKRVFGQSKYGLWRIPTGFLDIFTVTLLANRRSRPQRVLGMTGLFTFLTGLAATAWLAIWWILSRRIPGWEPIHLHERALFYYSLVALLLGAQLLSLGFLAELFAWLTRGERPPRALAEVTGPRVPSDPLESHIPSRGA